MPVFHAWAAIVEQAKCNACRCILQRQCQRCQLVCVGVHVCALVLLGPVQETQTREFSCFRHWSCHSSVLVLHTGLTMLLKLT